jgi:hypothetical protein
MTSTRQFIDQIAAGEASAAKDTFETMLSTKAFEALDAYKKEIASGIFGGNEVNETETEVEEQE